MTLLIFQQFKTDDISQVFWKESDKPHENNLGLGRKRLPDKRSPVREFSGPGETPVVEEEKVSCRSQRKMNYKLHED